MAFSWVHVIFEVAERTSSNNGPCEPGSNRAAPARPAIRNRSRLENFISVRIGIALPSDSDLMVHKLEVRALQLDSGHVTRNTIALCGMTRLSAFLRMACQTFRIIGCRRCANLFVGIVTSRARDP